MKGRAVESVAQARGVARVRKATLAAVGSGAARGIQIAVGVVTVPLLLQHLGTERYGLWMTISSMVTFISFADFGVGNGLLSAIAAADGREDRQRARVLVSNGLAFVTVMAALGGGAFGLLYGVIDWPQLLNVSGAGRSEAGPAVAAFVLVTLMAFPAGIAQRVQLGHQEGHVNSLWQSAGSILAVAGLLIAIDVGSGLPPLVLAFLGVPVVVQLMNGIVLFGVRKPHLRPRWRDISKTEARQLAKTGGAFLLLQLLAAVIFNSDNVIIARTLEPAAVAQYSVVARLYAIVGALANIALTPLWPAYGEALARGDVEWARSTLWRTASLSVMASAGSAVMLLLVGDVVVALWVGEGLRPSRALLVGLGLQGIVMGLAAPLSVFLNGAGVMRLQVILSFAVAIVAVPAKVAVARSAGVAGLPLCTAAAQFTLWVVPILLGMPALLRRMAPGEARPG